MSIHLLLADLLARIPELEWQLSKLEFKVSPRVFPSGLFRCHPQDELSAYSHEIKADINTLSHQTNQRVAHYLALRINQKINVLVSICQQHQTPKGATENVGFTLNKLSTRQQWLNNLETQINVLTEQKEALHKALTLHSQAEDKKIQLKLQAELGEIQKHLTLAQEEYAKATM